MQMKDFIFWTGLIIYTFKLCLNEVWFCIFHHKRWREREMARVENMKEWNKWHRDPICEIEEDIFNEED
jgi:hypothetical protein